MGGVLSQHALQVVSQHALQQVSGVCVCSGGCLLPGGCLLQGMSAPRGCLLWGGLLPGGVCSGGCLLPGCVPGLGGCGLLLGPSGLVAFWLKVVFWFGGLLIEGGLLVESGILFWPSGVIFCYGLLVGLLVLGVSPNSSPPHPPAYGKWRAGTHPTGMHSSCFLLITPRFLASEGEYF